MNAHRIGLPKAAIYLTLTAALVAFFSISTANAGAATSCFAAPSACGYPDATTAGVPAGTALTTVKSVTLGSGQILEGKNVTNGVVVTGPNVTIRNSRIATTEGGNGTAAIELQDGATNFTIERSEVTGNGSKTNAPESNVWNHYGNAGFRVIGSYLHGVPDNIEGNVAEVRDSFISVDAGYPGAHSENIYLCGGTANVQHSTLYNESDETSLIFGDGICGKGNTVTVENSMLAGGGYMLQPNAKGVSAPVRIVGNRVGRCLTAVHQDSGGGYVCADGADANGFWPRGGHYGLDTDLGSSTVWTGNVWDDNSQPMCPNEKAGCGTVTLPSEPTQPTEPTEEPEPPAEEPTEGEPPTEEPPTEEPPEPSEPPEAAEEEAPTKPGGGHGGHKGGEHPRGGGKPSERSSQTADAPAPPAEDPAPVLPADMAGEVAGALDGLFGGSRHDAAAIWHASRTGIGGPVILDGTDSKAPGRVTCIWKVHDPSGVTVMSRAGSCLVRYRFRRAGLAHVTLTVRGTDGTIARSHRAIVVGARQGDQPRVARAARAF